MRHKIFKLITIIFLVFQLFPPVRYFIPIGGALVIAIYVGISLIIYPEIIKNNSIVLLFIYTLFTLLYYISGNAFFDSINSVVIPFLTILSALLIVNYCIKYRDRSFVKTIVYVTILLLLTITITSIPKVYNYPNIIRKATDYIALVEHVPDYYYWIIGYGVIHGLSVVFAPLSFLIKESLKKRKPTSFIWIVITLSLLYIVYLSNATTALIISIISLLGGLFINYTEITKKNIYITAIISIVLMLLLNKTTIVTALDFIQPRFESTGGNYQKINDIKVYFAYGDAVGSVSARESLYKNSFILFLKSPIVGTINADNIGKHSYFLDRLAALGILFTVPLFLMFISHIKDIYERLNKTKVVYLIGCLCYLVMLSVKNDFGSGTFLFAFAILPIFCIYIETVICNYN